MDEGRVNATEGTGQPEDANGKDQWRGAPWKQKEGHVSVAHVWGPDSEEGWSGAATLPAGSQSQLFF